MAHYAKVDNGLVEQVIVADAEFFDTFVDSSPGTWMQTSYNTTSGLHTLGGTPLRKNFAAVGYTYNTILDAFIPPQPFPSWTLDEETCLWQPMIAHPNDGNKYRWNEETPSWNLVSE